MKLGKLIIRIGGRILKWQKRKRLKNHDFSIIANNCCGGIISHSLGEQFNSPTINMSIRIEDWFTFLENLEEATSVELYEKKLYDDGSIPECPLGELRLSNGEKIQCHFDHYLSFDDAKQKWIERCKRLRFDNLFIFFEAGVITSDDLVDRFNQLKYINKVIITNKPYPQTSSALFLDIYGKDYKPGLMSLFIKGSLHRYIELFDYIHWLNTGQIRYAKFYKKFIQ